MDDFFFAVYKLEVRRPIVDDTTLCTPEDFTGPSRDVAGGAVRIIDRASENRFNWQPKDATDPHSVLTFSERKFCKQRRGYAESLVRSDVYYSVVKKNYTGNYRVHVFYSLINTFLKIKINAFKPLHSTLYVYMYKRCYKLIHVRTVDVNSLFAHYKNII